MDLYVGNDNLVELDALKDATDGAYINDATVTVTPQDLSGNDVAGQAWPLTLAYVAGSNGLYRGVVQDAAVLTAGQRYKVIFAVDAGAGQARWEETAAALTRTS